MDGSESKVKTNGRLVRILFCYEIGCSTQALCKKFYNFSLCTNCKNSRRRRLARCSTKQQYTHFTF